MEDREEWRCGNCKCLLGRVNNVNLVIIGKDTHIELNRDTPCAIKCPKCKEFNVNSNVVDPFPIGAFKAPKSSKISTYSVAKIFFLNGTHSNFELKYTDGKVDLDAVLRDLNDESE